MNNTFLKKLAKSFCIALFALLFMTTSSNSFGQNLNVRSVSGGAFDAASITNTTPYTNVTYTPGSILFSGLPTDVSGYAGVDVLLTLLANPQACVTNSSDSANVSTDCGIGGGGRTIDYTKTQIATAPVVGEPVQKTLMVTIDVTTAGCLSPITISGSGMSIANGITEVYTTTTGVQTFSIPVCLRQDTEFKIIKPT